MSVESDEPIRLTSDGPVATIWLNRPGKRNAMNYPMWRRLGEVAAEVGGDRSVHVVVVRGSGANFCVGADITEVNVGRDAGEPSFYAVVAAAEAALAAVPKPTVAFISGDCIGGGCSIAIDCDLRIATIDSRFGITPAKLGIVYPSGALERAVHLLGPAATKRLLFTGELIAATEACRIGLVDEVVDGADAEERLAALTGVLAARSLLTQAATKSMVSEIVSTGQVSRSLQNHWSDVASSAPDSAEGVAAFVEKRAAHFTWSGPDGV